MTHEDATAAYIEAACKMQQLVLTPEQHVRVVQTFNLTAQMVAPLMAFELPAEIEAAPVFKA
jgi:hypothetical protein